MIGTRDPTVESGRGPGPGAARMARAHVGAARRGSAPGTDAPVWFGASVRAGFGSRWGSNRGREVRTPDPTELLASATSAAVSPIAGLHEAATRHSRIGSWIRN